MLVYTRYIIVLFEYEVEPLKERDHRGTKAVIDYSLLKHCKWSFEKDRVYFQRRFKVRKKRPRRNLTRKKKEEDKGEKETIQERKRNREKSRKKKIRQARKLEEKWENEKKKGRVERFVDMTNVILSFKNGIIILMCLSSGMILRADDRALSRQKRYLIFPQGSNVQLVYCLTIGAFAGNGDLVLGLTAALAWELPSKVDKKISKLLHRKSRSVLYPKIEAFLQSTGLDGKSCVMRALCEATRREENQVGNGTFIQELLHTVFKPRYDVESFGKFEDSYYDSAHRTEKSCSEEYSSCPRSIYELDF